MLEQGKSVRSPSCEDTAVETAYDELISTPFSVALCYLGGGGGENQE